MLEKGLKEMIKNGKNSGKGESCYACTSLTVVINGTMEIIAKPKQTDIVHKMRLPVQQKVQRCIDTSQPIPQHPQKVSTILKYSEKTGLTELSSQKVAGVASPFHLPPGMMMVKCQDPVPGMLQHGIPLVRLPGFVQSLPRPASVPSKSQHGSVAVAASQMTSGTKPVILAASSVQNQMNQTSSPQLLFVPNTIKVTTTGQTIPTAFTSYKPGGQLAINTQSHSVQPSQHRPASGNSCGAVADNQQARVEDPINMSKSSNNTTTFPSSSPQRPLTPEHANSTIPSSPGKHDGAGKIPTPHGKSSGNVSFEDQLVRIENLVEDLSTKKRKADSETTDCTTNKQLKLR
ncbi:uncharacterized protein [Ptychodera flava]|uniref:uncharacterized protein isoform X1 n=1 Tax=Ptychodera flava TaxID=63121 RepID=UPI003969D115